MIITVTINPAMDKVLVLDRFTPNETNRIKRHFSCVGGKGTHVSINLSLLGIRSIALGIVMGEVGREILDFLSSRNIDIQFVHLPEGSSRTNYVLLDCDGNSTLLAEKGPELPDAATEALVRRYWELVSENDFVVISGDTPGEKGRLLQDALFDIARQKKARVCLDTSGESLTRGVRKGPFLVKPNLAELEFLLGGKPSSETEILTAITGLAELGTQNVIVSLGSGGSLALAGGRYFRVIAPKVRTKNTVGCGDALLAGILAGFTQGLDVETNLKQATAIAAAAAMTELTAGFNADTVQQLLNEVLVEPLTL